MKKVKKISKFITDALLIIISVIFALFINEWRSNINSRNETNVILENVKQELENNLESAKRLKDYHESIRTRVSDAYEKDSLVTTFFQDGVFITDKVAPIGFLQENFSSIAWEVARQENISNRVDFETSRLIFEAYDQQESVLSTVSELLEFLDERETQRKEYLNETLSIMGSHMQNAVGQEQNMIYYYEVAIKQLNEKL